MDKSNDLAEQPRDTESAEKCWMKSTIAPECKREPIDCDDGNTDHASYAGSGATACGSTDGNAASAGADTGAATRGGADSGAGHATPTLHDRSAPSTPYGNVGDGAGPASARMP